MLEDDAIKFGLVLLVVLVVGAAVQMGALGATGPGDQIVDEFETAPIDEDLERDIHSLVNDAREERGLDTLEYNDGLSSVARTHSRDMVVREFYAHQGPDGDRVDDRVAEAGLECSKAGENIHAFNEGDDTAHATVNDWLESPGHRENLLRGAWEYQGIGVWRTDDGAIYVTQVFCQT